MKYIILILLYIACFMGYFFIISAVGLLWIPSYREIISCVPWFMVYSVLIGSWAATISCLPYYEKYIENENNK